MTERTDPMAENAASNALTDRAEMFVDRHAAIGSAGQVAEWIIGAHVVTWERDVNEKGVPVRRYVMRSEWEVDLEPRTDHDPNAHLRAGDTVVYLDRRDDGRLWTVQSVGWHYEGSEGHQFVGMTSPGMDEVAEHQYVPRSLLTRIRRVAG